MRRIVCFFLGHFKRVWPFACARCGKGWGDENNIIALAWEDLRRNTHVDS